MRYLTLLAFMLLMAFAQAAPQPDFIDIPGKSAAAELSADETPLVPSIEMIFDNGNHQVLLNDFPDVKINQHYHCNINMGTWLHVLDAEVATVRGKTRLRCLDYGILSANDTYMVIVTLEPWPEEVGYPGHVFVERTRF